MRRRAFLIGAGAAAAMPRAVAETGVEALAGDRFRIDDQDFQLSDIRAPSAYALHADAEPHFEESKRALEKALNGAVPDWRETAQPTRWGEKVVRADSEGASLQERLVEAGAARVVPLTGDLDFIGRLLTLEAGARALRRGLWALDAYRVFDAIAPEAAVGAFNLIEGAPVKAAKVGGRFYLNFGEDYKTDFTASAASGLARRWAKAGFDLARLNGVKIRVRGYVDEINGPSVDLKHIRQIEIL